jgi:hypothetical protein
MATGQMYNCETRLLFMEDGVKVSRWTVRSVEKVSKDAATRCMHCHGAVRIHQQQVDHGPADHVEHLEREDSENCLGGHYFPAGGVHKMSSRPVK